MPDLFYDTKEGKPNTYPICGSARYFTLAANRAVVTTQLDPKLGPNRMVMEIAVRDAVITA